VKKIKLLIEKASSTVIRVRMKFLDGTTQFKVPSRCIVRHNTVGEYNLSINLKFLEYFLRVNEIRPYLNEVEIDENSIDTFYGFELNDEINYSPSLTPKFVYDWWNRDCPFIYRYEINKTGNKYLMSYGLYANQILLVESGWSEVYTDESVTRDEFTKLCEGRMDSRIAKTIQASFKTKQMGELELSELNDSITNFENRIKECIEPYKGEIADTVKGLDENQYGLDSGWVKIYTTNEEFNNGVTLLEHTEFKRPKWLKIDLPIFTQSTNIQRKMVDRIILIAEKYTSEKLYAVTTLD